MYTLEAVGVNIRNNLSCSGQDTIDLQTIISDIKYALQVPRPHQYL